MGRPSLSPEQLQFRRGEILDAAQHLFETQGLDAVSFRRIAARAGCSPTTPYRYFPSKAHVLLGLRVRAYDTLRVELETAASAVSTGMERLRAIAATYIRFAVEQPATYGLLYQECEAGEDEPELSEAKAAALDICRLALAESQRDGELDLEVDSLTAVHLCWVAVHGVVSLHLGGHLVMGRSLDSLTPALISMLTAGFTKAKEES
jgi:AcrR family transcriptional regulator